MLKDREKISEPDSDCARLHADGLETLASLIAILQHGDEGALLAVADQSITARTSHMGNLSGAKGVASLFAPLTETDGFTQHASNTFLAGDRYRARLSAYISTVPDGRHRFLFGAVILVDLVRSEREGRWSVAQIKLQLTWLDGPAPGTWTIPVPERI